MKQSEKDDLVYYLSMAAFCCTAPPRPGELIKKLRPEIREKLQYLTSDDFRRVRYI